MEFREYFEQCLHLAKTDKQVEIMHKCWPIYQDAWEEGLEPEEIMEKEWG